MSELLTEAEMLAWTMASQRKAGEVRQAKAVRELVGAVAGAALTIASGSITPIQAYHIIDTESGAATDELDLIDPSNLGDGRIVILSIADASRVIIIKNGYGGTGQMFTADGLNATLSAPKAFIAFVRNGTYFREIFRAPCLYPGAATTVPTANALIRALSTGKIDVGWVPTNIIPPAGGIIFFAASSPPTGWLECNGADISRTVYSSLYSAIGTGFGGGDGSTTFNLPDLRGVFPRGWDHGRGIDSGRGFGSYQGENTRDHWHYPLNGLTNQFLPVSITGGGNTTILAGNTQNARTASAADSGQYGYSGAETRPCNVALLPCIKY